MEVKIVHIFIFYFYLALVQSQNCQSFNARPGRCVPLSSCPDAISQFYNAQVRPTSALAGADFSTFLADSICGFNGSNYLICCPILIAATSTRSPPYSLYGSAGEATFYFASLGSSAGTSIPFQPAYPFYPTLVPTIIQSTYANYPPIYQPRPPTAQSTYATYAPIYQPRPTTVTLTTPAALPTNTATQAAYCGIGNRSMNRVVGGLEAKRGSYPWLAALGYREEVEPNVLKFMCAGSLISDRFVVTSAHCTKPSLALVRLGAHDLSRPAESGAVDYGIRKTLVHESFNLKSIANDIALVELTTAAPRSDTIAIICLPESNNFLYDDFVGMNPFVAGWGAVKHQGAASSVLRDVQVPIVSRQTCEQNYRTIFKFVEFSDKLICAGSSNVDACQGDSGGPLMMPQLVAGGFRYFLLGIVSFGYECARPGFPGVYTKVADYVPWIKSKIQ